MSANNLSSHESPSHVPETDLAPRRSSGKLTVAPPHSGSVPSTFGVPRRPQSLPPKPSTESGFEGRGAYPYDRPSQPRTDPSARSETTEGDAQLFFVTDCSGVGSKSGSQLLPSVDAFTAERGRTTSSADPKETVDSTASSTQTEVPRAQRTSGSGASAYAENLYTTITQVLKAQALDFRKCTTPESIPVSILEEESAGIFMGQLPSSYTENDIECLLRALGQMHSKLVHVRDVKSHLRDRTCAFVMVNVNSVAPIIDFSKRVLCDMNNVWIVAPSQASSLTVYINNIPRQHLRGVPKLPLVLERLTHNGRSRRGSNAQTTTGRESARGSNAGQLKLPQQARSDSGAPLSPGQYAQMVPLIGNSRRNSLDSAASLSSFAAGGPPLQAVNMMMPGSLYQAAGIPISASQMYSVAQPNVGQSNPFQSVMGAPTEASPFGSQRPSLMSHLFSLSDAQQHRQSLASHSQMSTDLIDNSGGFNLAAPMPSFEMRKLSGPLAEGPEGVSMSTQSHGMSGPFISSHMGDASFSSTLEASKRPSSAASIPVASIPTVLPSLTCSCSQYLRLSTMLHASSCAQCNNRVDANMVAYWCPSGHLCVCTHCGMRIAFNSPFGPYAADTLRTV